jgi:polyribonucleotide nucleotidyltransferase
MKNATAVEVALGPHTLRLETGTLARQAGGSVVATYGDTLLLGCATASKKPREGIDFFPLSVEYKEKYYAAGRFPGGYFKREGRPSEKETLICRMTDRPIRVLFPEGYRNDVQIINTLMSTDTQHEPDSLSVNAASAALTLSEIPFLGPIGAVKLGRVNGQIIIEPTHEQLAQSDLELLYAGTRDKMIMIEGEADEISEADFLAAMKIAHGEVVKIIDAQLELRRAVGLPDKTPQADAPPPALLERLRAVAGDAFQAVYQIGGKQERAAARDSVVDQAKAALKAENPALDDKEFATALDLLETEIVRNNVIERGLRVDGRGFEDLRPLDGEVGILPRAHGSAWFGRGETQSVCVATLGTADDFQELDALTGGDKAKPFILHYNFPPYSVGETGRVGTPGRREVGHGNLAERALKKMAPKDYPYAIRVVSEITGSNGSSSMASACGGTLALLDAGVPMKKPVAGISVGMFSDDSRWNLVLDILGTEDHCGDMDFKVCGTRDGITAWQVDLKVPGLTWEQIERALDLARRGRLQILDFMDTVIAGPRAELSKHAPRYHTVRINPEKIGALIGPGGKNIRRITSTHNVQIDIEEDGTVKIFSVNPANLEKAISEIGFLTAEAEVGKVYEGVVTGTKEFGAFVEILPGLEGLVHISELGLERVRRTEDVVNVGDRIRVLCLDVQENGRVSLSIRALLRQEGGGGGHGGHR